MSKKLDTSLNIRKGSRAAFIMKVVPAYQKDSEGNIIKSEQGKALLVLNDDGSPKIGFKWYPVFNCSSIENMPPYIKVTNEVKPLDELELLSKALQCRRAFNFDHLCSLNFDQV